MTVVHADEVAHRAEPGGGDAAPRRRRGTLLVEEIYAACRDELREHGYSALTMDRVAVRARAGKATLYRRWPSKVELVADTLRHYAPVFAPPPDSGRLRDDLLALLRTAADELNGPACEASRGLIAELVSNPELAALLRDRLTNPIVSPSLEVLRRAVVRGEVSPRALIPQVAAVGGELLIHRVLFLGAPMADDALEDIVDWVILPMLRGLGAESPVGTD